MNMTVSICPQAIHGADVCDGGRYQGGGKCPVTGSHRSSSLSLLHCYRLQRGVDVDFKATDNAAYT